MDAEAIKNLRLRLGITQRQLSDRLGVDQGTVSRWERGVDTARPARQAQLRELLVKDEDQRHLKRCLAFVKNDLMPATFLDSQLKLVEMSASADDIFRRRGQDPGKLLGMTFERYVDRLGVPELLTHLKTSGLVTGEALFFRFVVNSKGIGNTTVWEPILEDGELVGVLNYVTSIFQFPKNSEFTIERVDAVTIQEPDKMVPLYRGPRSDLVPISDIPGFARTS